MTSNQIAYFKAKIEEAHYGRADTEQARSNRANEALTRLKLENENAHYLRSDAEQQRSNLAREQETHRSNVANESIEWAQIPARNAEKWANAERSYAEAGYKYAQTALTDQQARKTIAETTLTQRQADNALWTKANIIADTANKRAQRDYNLTKVAFEPFYAWSSVASGFGSILRGANGLGGLGNGKIQSTGKQTERWYENGTEHTTENYLY